MDRTKLLIKRGFTKGLYKSGILNEGMLDKYYEREKNGSVKLKAGIDIKAEGLKADEEEAELFPGKLMRAGVSEGYIITHINKIPINSVSDIEKTLKDLVEKY